MPQLVTSNTRGRACSDVIHEDSQLQRWVKLCNFAQCILQHNPQEQTAPLRPWQIGRYGPERFRRTSFKLYPSLVVEMTAQHSQDLSWETGMRRPSPDHKETDTLESLCQHRSLTFFLCFSLKSFHLHQNSPHRSLVSYVSAICSVPIHTILLLPLRHLVCPQSFPPTYQPWHKRDWPLTRNILRNQEEHRYTGLLQPFSALLHLVQELHDFSSRFTCQVQKDFQPKLMFWVFGSLFLPSCNDQAAGITFQLSP